MKKQTIFFLGIAIVAILLVVVIGIWRPSTSVPSSSDTPQVKITDERQVVEGMQYRYLDYASEAFAGASHKKRVLFFSSASCATCKATQDVFFMSPDKIPQQIVIFNVDMTREQAVAATYAVQTAPTFVQVDSSGKEVARWTDGGLPELLANVK